MATDESEFGEAFGYAWGILSSLSTGNIPLDESASAYAGRRMQEMRDRFPYATAGIDD
jgi:hypothetical protein